MTMFIQKFPIFFVEATFEKNGVEDRVTHYKMGKAQDLLAEEFIAKLMPEMTAAFTDMGRKILSVHCKYMFHDSWVLGWFSHSTWAIDGLSDDYYVKSFREFVHRHRWDEWNKNLDERISLMCAEDEWRWNSFGGFEADGVTIIKDYKTLPCRCEGCTARGVVSISH